MLRYAHPGTEIMFEERFNFPLHTHQRKCTNGIVDDGSPTINQELQYNM